MYGLETREWDPLEYKQGKVEIDSGRLIIIKSMNKSRRKPFQALKCLLKYMRNRCKETIGSERTS